MKKFFADFKKFILKGNILDLAVAVIIGGAFGKIVSSLINDIIMPLISAAVGGKSVTDWKWVIREATYDSAGILLTAESALTYGNFIQTFIDFLIIALCIFLLLRLVMSIRNNIEKGLNEFHAHNKKERKALVKTLKQEGKSHGDITLAIKEFEAKKAEESEAAEKAKKAEDEAKRPRTSEELLVEIRDILKEKNGK